jgi:NAD(P)-dependent dehydrogenase (short-subunit alcohol dehydrogenase family)
MVRLTKGCLPLLKAAATKRFNSTSDAYPPPPVSAPRIINVTSMAGLVTAPFLSPYNASKHAAEAFSACLRMELTSWNIKVSTCNPTFHTTPLVSNGKATLTRNWDRVDQATKVLLLEKKEEGGDGVSHLHHTHIT